MAPRATPGIRLNARLTTSGQLALARLWRNTTIVIGSVPTMMACGNSAGSTITTTAKATITAPKPIVPWTSAPTNIAMPTSTRPGRSTCIARNAIERFAAPRLRPLHQLAGVARFHRSAWSGKGDGTNPTAYGPNGPRCKIESGLDGRGSTSDPSRQTTPMQPNGHHPHGPRSIAWTTHRRPRPTSPPARILEMPSIRARRPSRSVHATVTSTPESLRSSPSRSSRPLAAGVSEPSKRSGGAPAAGCSSCIATKDRLSRSRIAVRISTRIPRPASMGNTLAGLAPPFRTGRPPSSPALAIPPRCHRPTEGQIPVAAPDRCDRAATHAGSIRP